MNRISIRIKVTFLTTLALVLLIVLQPGTFVSCTQKTTNATSSHPPVPAVPNNSIVSARVINIQEGEGVIPWVLTIEIQTSQDVAGYPNDTREKMGQQLLVRTMDDISRLKVSQIITAHVRFEGDEESCFYYIWDIH